MQLSFQPADDAASPGAQGPDGPRYLGTVAGSGPPVMALGPSPYGDGHGVPQEPAPSEEAKIARMYGALQDLRQRERAEASVIAYRRHRVNCVPALQCIFFPWLTYLLLSAAGAGMFHYERPLAFFFLAVLSLIAAIGFIVYAFRIYRKSYDWFYVAYLAGAMLVAVLAGALVGDTTFWCCLYPAYTVEHGATYRNVDPSSSTIRRTGEVVATKGSRYQDAGKVYFRNATTVDTQRSVSFKLGDLYCAAPIMNPTCSGECGADFWAVGINCCSETNRTIFTCGDVDDFSARSGVRLMSEYQRGLFRLAVLQAEGVYNLTSPHPLFFYWAVDPVAKIDSWKTRGQRRFLTGMYVFFIGNAACLAFTLGWRLQVLAQMGGYDK